ncbi:hypothetical protein BUALT_Bualt07G0040900 [Buddleja alternifolia]|uniref:Pentatricopeptide repeat-containing protein n=1 Tax=Buddleja alternifolia TaxID=168488 RepID=A0AAV6X841_9LAMI|nr:hypothetical protein BUALT_Bualt07G0040900 [Buddleja alternifolia]
MYLVLGKVNRSCQLFDELSERDVFSWSSLLSAYAKSGNMCRVGRLFSEMTVRNDVSCAMMVLGFVSCGRYPEVLRYFLEMLCYIKPNEVVLVCALSASAHLESLHQGNWIHTYIDKSCISETSNVRTALIDMYAKCGRIDCSSMFYNAESLWGVVPKIEHYGCYVDLLGCAGYLAKAFGVVKSMSVNSDTVIRRALLSACRIHRNLNFGERIVYYLEQINPHSCVGGDVLLSNLYASLVKWEKVDLIRKIMGKQKNQSDIGCSWIEVNDLVFEFRVADVLHPEIAQIRQKLREILKRARLVGYYADVTRVI